MNHLHKSVCFIAGTGHSSRSNNHRNENYIITSFGTETEANLWLKLKSEQSPYVVFRELSAKMKNKNAPQARKNI